MKLSNSFSVSIALIVLLQVQWACERGEKGHASELDSNVVESVSFDVLTRLSPEQLIADIDGDGKEETIFLVKNQQSQKEGICITELAEAKDCTIIGAGNIYFDVQDNLSWVQKWLIRSPGETFEITFKDNGDIEGSKQVFLSHSSLGLYNEDDLGGIITYREGGYTWIHQAH